MEFGGPIFVLSIIAMSFIAWILTTAIRARHGYPIENEWGGTITKNGGAELKRQNELLERIATDAPARLTAEIDKLRD